MVLFASPTTLNSVPRRRSGKRLALRAGAVLLLLCLVALAGAAAWFRNAASAALPQLDGTLPVAGLNAPATVLRDSHGVPAITTASPDDLFFAQGYVTAQDRLWQMDMSRRYAAGDLAEVLGKDYLNIDIAQRVLGLRQVADATVSRLSGRDRQYLESYARGVNAYISQHRRSLPLEFRLLRYFPRAWTPADSFLVGAMMSEMLNHYGYRDKLQRERIGAKLGPELAADLFPTTSGRDILPDGERPFASDAAPSSAEVPGSAEDKPEPHAHRRHRPSPARGNSDRIRGRHGPSGLSTPAHRSLCRAPTTGSFPASIRRAASRCLPTTCTCRTASRTPGMKSISRAAITT